MATTPEIRLDPPRVDAPPGDAPAKPGEVPLRGGDLDEARGLRALKFAVIVPEEAPSSDPFFDGRLTARAVRAVHAWLHDPAGSVLALPGGSALVAVDPATGKAVWWLGNAGGNPDG